MTVRRTRPRRTRPQGLLSAGALLLLSLGPAAGDARSARHQIEELLVEKLGGAGHEVRWLVPTLGRWWFNSAADASIGAELWSTRPATDDRGRFRTRGRPRADTIEAVMLVSDVLPGPEGSYPHDLCEHDGRLFFAAKGAGVGDELWSTNGISTAMVADINPGAVGSHPQGLISCGGVLYFAAVDATHGFELWAHRAPAGNISEGVAADGAPAGTTLVRDLTPGVGGSAVSEMACNREEGQLYFSTGAGSSAMRWTSNGTFEGTHAISEDGEEDEDDPAVQAARDQARRYAAFWEHHEGPVPPAPRATTWDHDEV